MPELPEVETVVRGLRQAGLTGRRIIEVRVLWARSVDPHSPAEIESALTHRRITEVKRRGKYICIRLENDSWLLTHLRMSGGLFLGRADKSPDKHDRVVITLDDRRALCLHDPRKFARMRCSGGFDETPLNKLGLEPLGKDFTMENLSESLKKHRRIKPLLLDQHVIAGLGNIYVDESLWSAAIHPTRRADTLDKATVARLYQAIPRVLRRAIASGGTSLGRGQSNFRNVQHKWGGEILNLRVYHRQGQPCPRCGANIERILVGQRATHICPHCQPPYPAP